MTAIAGSSITTPVGVKRVRDTEVDRGGLHQRNRPDPPFSSSDPEFALIKSKNTRVESAILEIPSTPDR